MKIFLSNITTYRKALELFDLLVHEFVPRAFCYELSKLVSQQIATADAIAGNIEAGYCLESRKGYAQFLIIARDSAEETPGRYSRMEHCIQPARVETRITY